MCKNPQYKVSRKSARSSGLDWLVIVIVCCLVIESKPTPQLEIGDHVGNLAEELVTLGVGAVHVHPFLGVLSKDCTVLLVFLVVRLTWTQGGKY